MLRRLGGWLLVVVGGLLALAGAVGAIVVGPDNAVQSDLWQLESPGAAIVTAPGVIDFAGPTLRLEAKSSEGPVFIGVGAQVDVEDLTSDLTYTQIDEIAWPDGELQTSEVQGSQDLLADVPDFDWWFESSEGDIAVVDFALPEDPVSVVVMNADGSAPVDVEGVRRAVDPWIVLGVARRRPDRCRSAQPRRTLPVARTCASASQRVS